MQQKRSPEGEMFGKAILVIGGGSIIASILTGSVIPLALAVVGLYGVLCFINGLKKPTAQRRVR